MNLRPERLGNILYFALHSTLVVCARSRLLFQTSWIAMDLRPDRLGNILNFAVYSVQHVGGEGRNHAPS